MDKKEFKQAITKVLSEYGFSLKNKIYRLVTEDLIIVIATQKSNYDNTYYINYGFSIKALHPNIEEVKDNTSDLSSRFMFKFDWKKRKSDSVRYEIIDSEKFSTAFKQCVENEIQPVLKYGLKKYFELYPDAIYVTSINAKEYLSLN